MSRARYLPVVLSIAVLVGMSSTLTGCKAQQQMQQQLADVDTRVQKNESRMTALENDIKKANLEIGQLRKALAEVTQATLTLQEAEKDRQRAALEAKQKAEAAAASKGKGAKKGPAKPAPKKKR